VRSVSINDYIWRWTRWGVWLIGLAAASVAACSVVVARVPGVPNWVLGPGVLAGLVAIGVLYSDRVVSHIVRTREPAEDPAHLCWQDALRAESIDRLYHLWVITFFNVALQVSFAFSQALRVAHRSGAADRVGDLMRPAALIVALVPIALSLVHSGAGHQWFRKRLWPTLAPGQVLQPGQPVPEQVHA
jgi:hypothetical protein